MGLSGRYDGEAVGEITLKLKAGIKWGCHGCRAMGWS